MPILVYNLTAAPLVLANGLSTSVPASTAGAGVRGKPFVALGGILEGRSGAEYIALQAQQDAGSVAFEWDKLPEFSTGALIIGCPPQALSGAGALSLTTKVTLFTSTGAAQALSLANGTYIGQTKTVWHTVAGGTGVITPASPGNFATVTLAVLYSWASFEWSGAVWNVVGFGGAAVVA